MTDEKPFARIDKGPIRMRLFVYGDPWPVCESLNDTYMEAIKDHLNTAASLYARERVKEAMERCAKVAELAVEDSDGSYVHWKALDIAAEIRRLMREEGK